MASNVFNPNEFGFEAFRMMTLSDVTFLVVVDGKNKAVGYVSRGDLIRAHRDKIVNDTIIEKGILARVFQ